MANQSNDPLARQDPAGLDRLLKEAYPAVEVSQDFKLRLWRKLMDRPAAELWKVPAPALCAALVIGIVTGIWSFGRGGRGRGPGRRAGGGPCGAAGPVRQRAA